MNRLRLCQRKDWNWHPCGDPPPIEHFECGCGTNVFAVCNDSSVKLEHYAPGAARIPIEIKHTLN